MKLSINVLNKNFYQTMTIKKYTEIIKNKRKETSYDEYMEEVLSWVPINFYKNSWEISRFPESERSPKVISNKKFSQIRDEMWKYSLEYNFENTFFENFWLLFKKIPMPATIQQMEWENLL